MNEILIGVAIGVVGTLGASLIRHRFETAVTSKRLASAFEEELRAVAFNQIGNPQSPIYSVAGFSTQTFDSLFIQMAQSMPTSLVQDLMRYHWRMKYLMATTASNAHKMGPSEAAPMLAQRDGLVERLSLYEKTRTVFLALRRKENIKVLRELAKAN